MAKRNVTRTNQQQLATQISLFDEVPVQREKTPVVKARQGDPQPTEDDSLLLNARREMLMMYAKKIGYPGIEGWKDGKVWQLEQGESAYHQAVPLMMDLDLMNAVINRLSDLEADLPQDHHHMELHYDDGFKEIICTADRYRVRHNAWNNYSGFVGPGIKAGEYCPICDASQKKHQPELDLLTYTRNNLKHRGPQDNARREWLRAWALEQGYKKYNFTMHGRYSGYFKTAVDEGSERWDSFLAKAVQFDVYCCYISARGPNPLSFYLEDAVKRGELSSWELDDPLLRRPSNHSGPRGG